MFRLTRQVRFSINDNPDRQLQGKPSNSYGGFPSLNGAGRYFTTDVTIAGELDPQSQYLMNIKSIDEAVRETLPDVERAVRKESASPSDLVKMLFDRMHARWPGNLKAVALWPTPFLSFAIHTAEFPMMRLSQKFEFSASHRLHNPAMSDEDNRRTFGKCNNPSGHGHNYEVQVTLVGKPNESGVLIDIPAFERTVAQTVIEPLDHKHLNTEVSQFRSLIPSVENIAKAIYEMLAPKLKTDTASLASVTVWETPKTWCEYAP